MRQRWHGKPHVGLGNGLALDEIKEMLARHGSTEMDVRVDFDHIGKVAWVVLCRHFFATLI